MVLTSEGLMVLVLDIVAVDLAVALVLEIKTFSLVFEIVILSVGLCAFWNTRDISSSGAEHLKGQDPAKACSQTLPSENIPFEIPARCS